MLPLFLTVELGLPSSLPRSKTDTISPKSSLNEHYEFLEYNQTNSQTSFASFFQTLPLLFEPKKEASQKFLRHFRTQQTFRSET